MKKTHAVAVFLFAFVAFNVFADTGLLDVSRYFSYFPPMSRGDIIIDNDYVWASTDEDYGRFSGLGGHIDAIDTPLEFALLSYYSQPVREMRPAQADAILPANNPLQADLKLGAAVFQELQVLRFLGDTAAVARHEAILQFITNRGNASRAEIEAFYRNNVRGLVAEVVDRAVRNANSESSRNITIPNDSIIEIKQLLTNFYLSPNQTDYEAIKNYISNRHLSDEREIQRIRQMNITGAGSDLRRRNMEIDVEITTTRLDIILLRSRIDLGFR